MPRVKQFDQEEVLQKAVEIFWKKGFNATSMDDLVKNLGINRASLYDTFGGKKQLYTKALNKYIGDNRRQLIAFFEEQENVKEGLELFFNMFISSTMADCDVKGCFVVNTSTELLPHDPETEEILIANRTEFEKLFRYLLEKGKKSGELSSEIDVESTAAYLVTFFQGLKVMAKLKPDEKDLERIIRVGLGVIGSISQ